ncbi:LysR family transcriptional regulator [Labrys sp. KB_33_2]|uniref:LysR family transcriptional regulator n=1 Tax=Labrys sp. KB_33_2 TaxID=3237479 RepID=UPI003F927748
MDQLTAFKAFRQAAERGSFAEAARALGLSPAAISKNIGELEATLSLRLFNRTTRRMSLTEAGALYYERVRQILDDIDDAGASIGALRQAPNGLLRVCSPMTMALKCLTPALPDFLHANPALSLDLNMDDRRIDIIQEGYDIAIRGSDLLEDSSLVARKLMAVPHVVCGAPSYFARAGLPARPEDLRQHDCVRFTLSSHADHWHFDRNGETVGVPVRGRFKVTSSLAVRQALLGGFGLSLIPRIYVEDDLRTGRLQPALTDWHSMETSIFAIYPSKRHLVPKVRVFLDFAAEQFARSTFPEI